MLCQVFCDYSMLITLYKIGELHFRLLGKNGFHIKAKSERFTTASSRCCQNLKYENFTLTFCRLSHNIAPKSVPHVQHNYFSSFNKSNLWFVALPSSNLKFPIVLGAERRGPVLAALMLLQIKLTCQIGNNNNYGSESDKSISEWFPSKSQGSLIS